MRDTFTGSTRLLSLMLARMDRSRRPCTTTCCTAITRNGVRNSIPADEGFSFGQGYGSSCWRCRAFAGVIVGVVQAVYLHLIMGYANYTVHDWFDALTGH